MISFRFHVVSITAVFLAIAIGVVVGSTFVDRAIVDSLEERIDTVSQNLDERRAEIARLEGELGRVEDFVDATAPYSVSGRLADRAVLVVALRGVDDEPVRGIVELAEAAGATAPGVLWVEPRWSLADDGAAAELAELTDEDPDEPDEARNAAWEAVLAELEAPAEDETEEEEPADPVDPADPADPVDPATTTVPEEPEEEEPDVAMLTALLEGGFFSFEPVEERALESVADQSPAVIVVTAAEVEEGLDGLATALVAELVRADLSTLVAEVYEEPADDDPDAPEQGAAATAAVPEAATTDVAVVDHADRLIGRVAAILALAELDRGVAGRYGLGDGASALVPDWTPL